MGVNWTRWTWRGKPCWRTPGWAQTSHGTSRYAVRGMHLLSPAAPGISLLGAPKSRPAPEVEHPCSKVLSHLPWALLERQALWRGGPKTVSTGQPKLLGDVARGHTERGGGEGAVAMLPVLARPHAPSKAAVTLTSTHNVEHQLEQESPVEGGPDNLPLQVGTGDSSPKGRRGSQSPSNCQTSPTKRGIQKAFRKGDSVKAGMEKAPGGGTSPLQTSHRHPVLPPLGSRSPCPPPPPGLISNYHLYLAL